MPVPDARMEFEIGAWVDVTDHVRKAGLITHTRGRQEGGARVDPGHASFTVESPNGLYSDRNPNSPYFGQLPRNTLARMTVAGPAYLAIKGDASFNSGASTPDHASLDITGDIDIRFDATLVNWLASGSVELCGKGAQGGNQRSWLLMMRDQKVLFEWSTAGTSVISKASTVAPVVPTSGRMAVRVTLDVDNGSSGNTVTFYTAGSLSGPWTQLGDPVVTAGVTSIFNSSAPVRVGDGWDDLGFPSSSGKVHAAEVRNGFGGTVVAAPDFSLQTAGSTSFTDSTGKVWTVGSNSSISDRWRRFTLSVPEWPPSWHVSGHDVKATLQAAGTLRRLGQGAKALDSTLRRRIPSYSPLAYWPMEDQGDASQAASPIAGVLPMKAARLNWGQADTLASSAPLPTLASSGSSLPDMLGRVPAPASTPTAWSVIWLYRLDTINTVLYTFMRILSTGTVAEWYIQQRNDMTRILALDSDGATVFSQDITTGTDLYNQWVRVKFTALQDGGNVDWNITWTDVGGDSGFFSGTFAGTLGRPTGVGSPAGGYAAALDGMGIGHVSVWSSDTTTPYDGAVDAWTGEAAGARIIRLAAEEGLPISVSGTAPDQALMGPQRPDTLLTLLGDCEASDGGILYEDRESTGLWYRDRASLYNQPPALTIPYGQLAPPLTPVDDDLAIRNDITVQRINGSSARVVVEDGPLSVKPPPDGVGIYDESISLSLHSDEQPEQIAAWRTHLGTWDEARYPSVRLFLHKYPALMPQVLALDVGDVIRVTDLPSFLPPGPVDLMVMGYREELGPFSWEITLFCVPAGPWTVGVVDTARADMTGSTLSVGVTSSATSWSVASAAGTLWITTATHPTEFPFDVLCDGERVTVTAITGASSPQTFTVTRSVNGIIKSHLANAPIALVQPAIAAL